MQAQQEVHAHRGVYLYWLALRAVSRGRKTNPHANMLIDVLISYLKKVEGAAYFRKRTTHQMVRECLRAGAREQLRLAEKVIDVDGHT